MLGAKLGSCALPSFCSSRFVTKHRIPSYYRQLRKWIKLGGGGMRCMQHRKEKNVIGDKVEKNVKLSVSTP
jgi:hypothetical protein